MDVKSFGSAQYYVTFIDDHSRKVWFFLLRTKDKVLESFKIFHVVIERKIGKKLNVYVQITVVSIGVHLRSIIEFMRSSIRR